MRVIKPSTVKEWARQYGDAATALENWLRVTQAAVWESIHDVRKSFPHADAVRVASGNTVTVFNVCGNKYRLIASLKYTWKVVYCLRFLKHGTYSEEQWKGTL